MLRITGCGTASSNIAPITVDPARGGLTRRGLLTPKCMVLCAAMV